MTNSDNKPEQSMEEIIASIRKMIAEEPEPASPPARSITEQTPSSASELIPSGADLTTFFDQSPSSAALSSVSEASFSQPDASSQASRSQTAWPFAEAPFEPDTNFPEQPSYPADQDSLYPASLDVPHDVQRHEQHVEAPDAQPPLSPFSEYPAINPAGGHEDESERWQDFEHGPAQQPGYIPENDDGQFNPPLSGATALPAESGEPAADHAALSDIAKVDAMLSETVAMAPVFPSDSDAESSVQSSVEDMTQSAETGEPGDQDDFSYIAKADIALVDPSLTVSDSLADNDDDFCDQFAYGDMAVPAENSDQAEHHKPDAAEAEAASPTSESVTDRQPDDQVVPVPAPQPDGLEQEISDHTEALQAEQFVGSLQKITEESLESIGFIRLSPEESGLQPSEHSGQPIDERLDDVVDHPDVSQAPAGLHESSVQSVSSYASDDIAVGDGEACESMEETRSAKDAEDEDGVPDTRMGTQMSIEEQQTDAHDEPSMPVHEESLAGAVKSADQPSGTGSPQPQIEAALSDLIRPIIHRWLEDNVPVIIDSAVKKNKTPKDDGETH